MNLVNSYIPVGDREQITRDYLIRTVDNLAIQRHSISVDTIGTVDRPVCKDVGENTTAHQLIRLEVTLAGRTKMLSAQSAMLNAQSQAMCKLMTQLKVLEHCARKPAAVQSHNLDLHIKHLWGDNNLHASVWGFIHEEGVLTARGCLKTRRLIKRRVSIHTLLRNNVVVGCKGPRRPTDWKKYPIGQKERPIDRKECLISQGNGLVRRVIWSESLIRG